jgi:hypothetical protein
MRRPVYFALKGANRMSDHGHTAGRFRVHWDPTIKLGDAMTCVALLFGAGVAYATLDVRMSQNARDIARVESDLKVSDSRIELDLGRRIVEVRQHVDATQVRTGEDIRDMKAMMRDGFRDLDVKLDRKLDKPSR